ncbi:MAG TPA: M28 family peptidase, partial [Pyrinomonadaceae bacterium]|nr:M28 family peptidase [Pyrinomonadaceae bacterium]
MRKFLSVLILTSVLALPFSPAVAQRPSSKAKSASSTATQRGVDTITAAQMRDYLSFIASDEMEGRDTPSRGLDTTAKFLAMNLARWGYKPGGDSGSYLQKIALRRDGIDKDQTTATLNDQPLKIGEDYIPVGRGGEASGPLVFAGNGWFFKSKNIDAYKDVDAKGKIAVIFTAPDGLPRGFSPTDLSGKRGEDWIDPGEYARKQGAVGVIIVPNFQFLANWQRSFNRVTEGGATTVESFSTGPGAGALPTMIASPRLANLLFQGESQNGTALFDAAGANTLPASFELKPEKKVTMKIVAKHSQLSTQNVVAVLEGSDPVLKDEYVAVGAHYDHVGIGNPVNGDAIYNGADDDGSGTT